MLAVSAPSTGPPRRPLAAWSLHLTRVALLAAILATFHWQYLRTQAQDQSRGLETVPLERVQTIFPAAANLGGAESRGGLTVLDAENRPLGSVVQTAPDSDSYLGFSGPTNCLIGFDNDGKIAGVTIINSRDTRDHVALIARNAKFLKSWNNLTWDQASRRTNVDGVSGATLTSLAIAQGLQRRLGATVQTSKFPEPLTLADSQQLFPEAASVVIDSDFANLWHINDDRGRELGLILRTSPAADEVIGYQGPTETRIGIRSGGEIIGVAVGSSFDNEPYVTYVRDDDYFRSLFKRYNLPELAQLDLQKARIEGVSGATMTSLAVARGIIKAAADYEAAHERQKTETATNYQRYWRTAATFALLAFGLVLGLTNLRGIAWLRTAFQIFLIGYLGLTSGELLSLAMFVGWGQSGIPWQNALGLVALAAAAIALPIAKGNNIYCSHLCPHGAAQQLLPRRWRLRQFPKALVTALHWIRPLLLAWVVLVAAGNWPFNLVNIEPFDAYSWRAAAWPTTAIAIGGLLASLLLPMGYCRYGCPTGAVLEYLRRHGRSQQWTRADSFAVGCLLVAIILVFVRHGSGGMP